MSETPLTARELARLFRAFAHFLETAEPAPEATRRRRKGRPLVSFTEEDRAIARRGLRKLGILP